jgi:hypothetical protein
MYMRMHVEGGEGMRMGDWNLERGGELQAGWTLEYAV